MDRYTWVDPRTGRAKTDLHGQELACYLFDQFAAAADCAAQDTAIEVAEVSDVLGWLNEQKTAGISLVVESRTGFTRLMPIATLIESHSALKRSLTP